MGYLICQDCGGHYKLKKGESIDDFDSCTCGGELKFVESLEDKNPENMKQNSKPQEDESKNLDDKKCPNCGTYNNNNAVFCKKCGKDFNSESVSNKRGDDKMVEELFCGQCGKTNSPESKFCNYCGSNLTKGTPKNSITKKKKASTSLKNHNTVILGYILSFIFVPVGLVIGMYLISQTSEYAKKHGWVIFGIAFTISFLIIVLLLSDITSQLKYINYDINDIYDRMGRMHLY